MIIDAIEATSWIRDPSGTPSSVPCWGSFFHEKAMPQFARMDERYGVTNSCDGCGFSGRLCPRDNIAMENGSRHGVTRPRRLRRLCDLVPEARHLRSWGPRADEGTPRGGRAERHNPTLMCSMGSSVRIVAGLPALKQGDHTHGAPSSAAGSAAGAPTPDRKLGFDAPPRSVPCSVWRTRAASWLVSARRAE